jgi:hypothetical protein
MGRLPDTFAGQKITARFPYNMPAELVIGFSQNGVTFPDVVFTNQVDKPFEIHRLLPRVAALDNNQLLLGTQPDQDTLQALVRLDILDFRTDQKFTKAPTLIRDMVKGTSERTWELAEPYTLPNSGGFQIAVTTLAEPASLVATVTSLKIELNWQGFLIQIAAPSDSR